METMGKFVGHTSNGMGLANIAILAGLLVICSISWYVVRSLDTMSIASATGLTSESADSCWWALSRISVTSTGRKIPRIKR